MTVTGPPEIDLARIRRWCGRRVSGQAREQVRIECEVADRHVTIVESRKPGDQGGDPTWTRLPVARLRYTRTTGTWTLYYRDRNLSFRQYRQASPTPTVGDLLDEVARDPTHIFWG